MHATARVKARGKPVGVISLLQSYGSQESAQVSHLYLLSRHVHSPPSFAFVGLGSSSAIEPLPSLRQALRSTLSIWTNKKAGHEEPSHKTKGTCYKITGLCIPKCQGQDRLWLSQAIIGLQPKT